MVLYGVGIIVGAGIYVLIGTVAARAGYGAPLAFLIAGALAALVTLSYAEFVTRFPEAAGAAAYVKEGLGSVWLSGLVGFTTVALIVLSCAAIALGSGGYAEELLGVQRLPAAAVLVLAFTALACLGVRQAVGVAALMAVLEIGGLLFVIVVGAMSGETPQRPILWTNDLVAPFGLLSGAFAAFFAYIGFESMVNLAEEVERPERTMPRALLTSIAIAALLYVGVAVVSVSVMPPAELATKPAALAAIVETALGGESVPFNALALGATANGVLIEIIAVSRLVYGMAHRGLLPAWFGVASRRTQVPVRATLVAGGITALLVVAIPFDELVVATSSLTLAVFGLVNLALYRLKRRETAADSKPMFRVPLFLPALTAVLCAALIAIGLAQ